MSSAHPTTVYVELLDEGADVWRPVLAEEVRPGCFLLQRAVPEEEQGAFQPGALVERELLKSSGGNSLVALRVAAERRVE